MLPSPPTPSLAVPHRAAPQSLFSHCSSVRSSLAYATNQVLGGAAASHRANLPLPTPHPPTSHCSNVRSFLAYTTNQVLGGASNSTSADGSGIMDDSSAGSVWECGCEGWLGCRLAGLGGSEVAGAADTNPSRACRSFAHS